MSQRLTYIFTGLFMAAGFFAFGFFNPLRTHVLVALTIFSFVFIVYGFSVVLVRRGKNPIRTDLFVLLFFSLLFRLLMLRTAPSLSDDIYRYVWDGRVQQAGLNPYLYPPAADELSFLHDDKHSLINHRDVRTVYPPVCQWVFRAGTMVQPTINMQRLIFLGFDIGVIFILLFLLRETGRSLLWVLIYAWNPLVVVEFAGSGHNDSLMIFFILLGLLLIVKNKKMSGIALLAVSMLSKLVSLVMIPWLLLKGKFKGLALFCFVLFLGYLPFSSGISTMLRIPIAFGGMKTYVKDWVFNPSIYGLMGLFIANPMMIRVTLGAVLVVFAFYWARRNLDEPLLYAFGCLYALLLCSPVVHPWYVTWIIPFLCFYPLLSGLAWSGLVFFSYFVLIRYQADGVWALSPVVMWIEYLVVYGTLLYDIRRRCRHPRA